MLLEQKVGATDFGSVNTAASLQGKLEDTLPVNCSWQLQLVLSRLKDRLLLVHGNRRQGKLLVLVLCRNLPQVIVS